MCAQDSHVRFPVRDHLGKVIIQAYIGYLEIWFNVTGLYHVAWMPLHKKTKTKNNAMKNLLLLWDCHNLVMGTKVCRLLQIFSWNWAAIINPFFPLCRHWHLPTNQRRAPSLLIRSERRRCGFSTSAVEVWTKHGNMTRKLQSQTLDDGKSRKRVGTSVFDRLTGPLFKEPDFSACFLVYFLVYFKR